MFVLGCVKLTSGAKLDDLAPLGHGVVSVALFGRGLYSHCVLCAWTQEPVTPHRHGQGHGLSHQFSRNVLGKWEG